MNPRTARVGRMIAALVVTTGCLAACSSTDADVELPQQNVTQWVMPLDQYGLKTDDLIRSEYAANLLEKPCMESAGYVYDVPWRDLTDVSGETWNSVHRRLFDEALAAKWGYHMADSPEPTLDDSVKFGESLRDLSDAGLAALETCINEAREELPLIQNEANYVSGIVNTAYKDALDDEAVTKAATAWHECMLPLGLPDLPDSPELMPPPSLLEGMEGDAASADEIQIAVADARCRTDSGYTDALYEAEWTHQAELAGENIDELERVGDLLAENAALVKSIIASHPIAHSG
jgi:hypothetical protein